MNEPNKDYINYLNSLNSYNAKNKNAYSEKNIENEFYQETSIEIGVAEFVRQKLTKEQPQVIILTGQAGDGKTSILYQIIKKVNPSYNINVDENAFEININENNSCYFIKDFSEIQNGNRVNELDRVLKLPSKNKFAFIVANTGPLINTFGQLFQDNRKDEAKMNLIKAIKESNGQIKPIIDDYYLSIINMADLDNSYFAKDYISAITKDILWEKCSLCSKKDFCPILKNKILLSQNLSSVQQFIENHYIWLSEHGTRLTVRSITEQLSFILTGGKTCNSIKDNKFENYKYLFPNLFFGLNGFKKDSKAMRMVAIKAANNNPYYLNKMNIDEQLIIKEDFDNLFSNDWVKIIKEVEKQVEYSTDDLEKERNLFNCFLRRIYLFQNKVSTEQHEIDMKDIFSKYFSLFIKHRKEPSAIPRTVKKLIIEALSMIYTGTKGNGNNVPITLNKKSGLLQSVQFVTGYLNISNFDIVKVKSNDGALNQTKDIYYFYPEINKQRLSVRLTLPLFDYFDNLQKGIIETEIDPLLSHGIETFKVEVSELVKNDRDEDLLDLLLLQNNGTKNISLAIDDETITLV